MGASGCEPLANYENPEHGREVEMASSICLTPLEKIELNILKQMEGLSSDSFRLLKFAGKSAPKTNKLVVPLTSCFSKPPFNAQVRAKSLGKHTAQ